MKRTFTKKKPAIPFETTIDRLSHEGRGIAMVNGKKKFLQNGLPHETVIAIDTRRHSTYDEGEVMEVLSASTDRIDPVCPHTQICGGCSLQHMNPDSQLQFKQTVLMEQLQHIGGITPIHILAPLKSPTVGYRHKARLGVKYVGAKQKVLVGFREKNGRYLADIDQCSVLHPSVGQQITTLSQFIQGLDAYDSIPQIEVAIGDDATALIFRHLQPLSEQDIAQLKIFGDTHHFSIYLQPGGIDSIHLISDAPALLSYDIFISASMGNEDENDPSISKTDISLSDLKDMGRRRPHETPQHSGAYVRMANEGENDPSISKTIKIQFHPNNFTQINPYINQKMINQAIALLKLTPDDELLDLFCGLGNFTLPLAKYCRHIIGVEGEEKLVKRAMDNAILNNIENAQFYTANLCSDFSTMPFMQKKFDKILLDPPRTGALETVKIIAALKVKLILYVSCNPATLARDAKILIEHGYQLMNAGVMDMFPHTSHVESMALFELRGNSRHFREP